MSTNMHVESVSAAQPWQTREQIALHFQCSPRTVGNLMRRQVLPFCKVGNLVRFDLIQCDEAFEYFRSKSRSETGPAGSPSTRPRQWRTKKQIAEHLQVSLRTVTHLLCRQILPYVKIGHLVRIDAADADAAMDRLRKGCLAD